MKLSQLLNDVSTPDVSYRPVPFWSFNDELKAQMLRWQVGQQKEAGLGGYFLHARSGLRTKYMSEDWMNALQVCIEEGQRLGIRSWLYDENGWPSGFADVLESYPPSGGSDFGRSGSGNVFRYI